MITHKSIFQLVCGYMHYTQILAESSQLSEITDVYHELKKKHVSGLKVIKVTTVTEEITVE